MQVPVQHVHAVLAVACTGNHLPDIMLRPSPDSPRLTPSRPAAPAVPSRDLAGLRDRSSDSVGTRSDHVQSLCDGEMEETCG